MRSASNTNHPPEVQLAAWKMRRAGVSPSLIASTLGIALGEPPKSGTVGKPTLPPHGGKKLGK